MLALRCLRNWRTELLCLILSSISAGLEVDLVPMPTCAVHLQRRQTALNCHNSWLLSSFLCPSCTSVYPCLFWSLNNLSKSDQNTFLLKIPQSSHDAKTEGSAPWFSMTWLLPPTCLHFYSLSSAYVGPTQGYQSIHLPVSPAHDSLLLASAWGTLLLFSLTGLNSTYHFWGSLWVSLLRTPAWFKWVPRKIMCWKLNPQIHMLTGLRDGEFRIRWI